LKVGNHFATDIRATKNRVTAKRVASIATALKKQKIVLQ